MSYGQIISIILVILLVYILYKIFKSYRGVKETFVGKGVGTDLSGVYGYNEDGEPFKFYITANYEIIPYIWRRDVSGYEGWCQWYESSDISCSRIDAPFGLPEDTPTWDTLVDASSGYLMKRFEELYLPNTANTGMRLQKIRIEYAPYRNSGYRHLVFEGLEMSIGDTFDSSKPITLFNPNTNVPNTGDWKSKPNNPIDKVQFHSDLPGTFNNEYWNFSDRRYWECSYEIPSDSPYVIRIIPRKNDGDYHVKITLKDQNDNTIETRNAIWPAESPPVDLVVYPSFTPSNISYSYGPGTNSKHEHLGNGDFNSNGWGPNLGLDVGNGTTSTVINENMSNIESAVYLQVDLGSTYTINGFHSMGRSDSPNDRSSAHAGQYVTSFMLTYSLDGTTWTADDKNVYIVNEDNTPQIANEYEEATIFVNPIVCRYIRVYPKTYNGHPVIRVSKFIKVDSDVTKIREKFQQQYAQDKYIYNCTHPNEVSCNIWYDGGNHFGQDCGGVTSSDNNPGYCWQPTANASYIPYFDRYENSRRGFFEKNKTNAAYDASLAMYDDIYDVSYSDTDAWREGTADTSINFYMGWNEGENNDDLPTQVMNPDGRYGYNIMQDAEINSQLPINQAASSVLTYNPSLNTYCGNVCFNGNENSQNN